MSTLSTIKRLAHRYYQAKAGELKGLVLKAKPATHAIETSYIVVPKQKTTMTKRQKKLKARRVSRQSRVYNLRRGK